MLAGIILAGGQSSRMGADKSALTLPTSQQSLLEHNQILLTALCGDNVFVSGGQHANGIADIMPDCGPLSGLHAVIKIIQTRHLNINEILVVPVDMPSLQVNDLDYLVTKGQSKQQACYFDRYYLPIYLPLSNQLTDYLNTLFSIQNIEKKADYSVKTLLLNLPAIAVAKPQHTKLSNINTPQEWHSHISQQTESKV
jgi:molybdopterin-guanine dinucleotide biosynthesis protein A